MAMQAEARLAEAKERIALRRDGSKYTQGHCDDHGQRWRVNLPLLRSAAELEANATWRDYYREVYGDGFQAALAPADFPWDTAAFQILHSTAMAKAPRGPPL